MAVNVNCLRVSASVALTYSAEVVVGKVVLMQPRLNSIHTAAFGLRKHSMSLQLCCMARS